MSNSDWDKKRTSDAYLAQVPYGLRQQMQAEAEKTGNKNANTVTALLTKNTGNQKKTEGVFNQFVSIRRKKKNLSETTVTGGVMVVPKPLLHGVERGTEDFEHTVKTSPGGKDNHVHTAYIDGFGNGDTSFDSGHRHNVVSFQVVPHQDPSGMFSHEHSGKLSPEGLPTYYPSGEM